MCPPWLFDHYLNYYYYNVCSNSAVEASASARVRNLGPNVAYPSEMTPSFRSIRPYPQTSSVFKHKTLMCPPRLCTTLVHILITPLRYNTYSPPSYHSPYTLEQGSSDAVHTSESHLYQNTQLLRVLLSWITPS